MLGKTFALFVAATGFVATVAAGAAAAPLQFDHDDPLFRLLTAAPQKRFTVAAEIVLDPELISTEAIRQRVAVSPFKHLFRASKTAQAALDFVLLKRDGQAVPPPPVAESTRAPNVLLISVAGLRADFVGAYGQRQPTTPRLDALAAQGAVLPQAYSTSAWSVPGTASLLTSLYPSRHGLESEGTVRDSRLDRDATTLAEALAGVGFDTAALVADPDLAGLRGFADGFDLYLERNAGAVELATLARLWLEWHLFHAGRGLEPGPFFLFLQFADLDAATEAPPAYRSIFPATDGLPAAKAVAAYAAGVRAIDDQIGVVLDALDAFSLATNTAVVVTASHGRELGERGAFGEATSLHQEQLRVPLILRLPPSVAAGQRVSGIASTLDVLPTLLGWSGAAIPAGSAGIGLVGSVRSPGEESSRDLPERDLYAELGPADREWSRPFHDRSVRSGGWNAIVRRNSDGSNDRRLFQLDEDPGEERDLAASEGHRQRLDGLEAKLRAHMAAAPARTPPPTPVPAGNAPAPDAHDHTHQHDE